MRLMNLNCAVFFQKPIETEKRKTFSKCCFICCIQSNVCHMVCRIPYSAYAPGQTINVEIKTDNNSNKNITDYWLEIVKVTIHQPQ